MWKKIVKRALVSAPVGMVVHQLVAICVSFAVGQGSYMPVTPAFAARFSSELAAVVTQILLVGLVSATFASCSVIFEIERWGLLRQCALHLLITSAVLIPVCLYCWMPESMKGVWALAGSWLFCYMATWLPQYFIYRHRVRALDAKIREKNGEGER